VFDSAKGFAEWNVVMILFSCSVTAWFSVSKMCRCKTNYRFIFQALSEVEKGDLSFMDKSDSESEDDDNENRRIAYDRYEEHDYGFSSDEDKGSDEEGSNVEMEDLGGAEDDDEFERYVYVFVPKLQPKPLCLLFFLHFSPSQVVLVSPSVQ
jgi:hypothetical protein